MKNLVSFLFLTFSWSSYAQAQGNSPRVGEITQEQQFQVRTRVESLNSTSFSFGPSWASDTNNENMYYSVHVGRNWEASVNGEIRLNLDAALASQGTGSWLAGTIGGAWLFSTSDISPVVGGEFGYGYTHIKNGTDANGFVVGGFAGVRFLRTSTAQLSLEAFVQSILNQENPILSGLRFGIIF
jgi:hypothetical protein